MTEARTEIPDWLQDDEPELTEEEIQSAWVRFAKADLIGKEIDLVCSGGDRYRITATIDRVITILGIGVALRISGVVYTVDEDSDQQPRDLPEARYVILDNFNYPPKSHERTIVFTMGVCVNQTGELSFGADCLDTGFIFL